MVLLFLIRLFTSLFSFFFFEDRSKFKDQGFLRLSVQIYTSMFYMRSLKGHVKGERLI